jgi:thiosulfate reductase cytochrome b subunit
VPRCPAPVLHPLAVRIAHWLNAVAIACMISSGWGIYNASPIFGFKFAPG